MRAENRGEGWQATAEAGTVGRESLGPGPLILFSSNLWVRVPLLKQGWRGCPLAWGTWVNLKSPEGNENIFCT